MDKPKDKSKLMIIVMCIVCAIAIILAIVAIIFSINKNHKKNDSSKKDSESKETIPSEPEVFEEKTYDYKKKTATKTNKDDILITFDTNGGKEMDDMIVKQNQLAKFPIPEREGYFFVKWLDQEGFEYYNNAYPYSDMNLTAVWIRKTNSLKTMTIYFNGKEFGKLEPIQVICDKPIKYLPKVYNIDNYYLKGWYTPNGVSVTNNSILPCEDITLEAIVEKSIIAKCPSEEYHFISDKCYKEVEQVLECPEGTTKIENKCLNLNDIKPATAYCLYSPINLNDNEQVDEKGEYIGNGHCAFHEWTGYTEEQCNNDTENNTIWENGKCYAYINSNFSIYPCESGYFMYNPNIHTSLDIPDKNEPKCIKEIELEPKCPEGSELSTNKQINADEKPHCVITAEATFE